MPIREYVPVEPPGCALCCYGFERLERFDEPALAACPACAGPIRHALGAVTVVSGQAHVLREGHLARQGFSQYRRVEKGKYEKTTGDGPDSFDAG